MIEAENFYREHLSELNCYELEEVERALRWRWNEIYAKRLESRGFRALVKDSEGFFPYILVAHDSDGEAEWATPAEAQILLDTVANLPPEEAWERWVWKKEPRPDLSAFEPPSNQEKAMFLQGMAENFLNSDYGRQFSGDVIHIRALAREINREATEAAYDLRRLRREMQIEFLQMVDERGIDAIRSQWQSTLKGLAKKYKLSRSVVRDSVSWALENRNMLIKN
jgi:hypothetical protein